MVVPNLLCDMNFWPAKCCFSCLDSTDLKKSLAGHNSGMRSEWTGCQCARPPVDCLQIKMKDASRVGERSATCSA